MLLPSKVTCYSESIFPLGIVVLEKLKNQDKEVRTLYLECKLFISELSLFISVLDFLFAVGKIELIREKGTVHYVA